MIRVAFTLIGGKDWMGGYNYLLNLVRTLAQHAASRVQPVLFFGVDIDEQYAAPFDHIAGVEVIRSTVFNDELKGTRFRRAVWTGCDQLAAKEFAAHGIDVVFENAQFYGWRFSVPVVAWIPDFQHRHMRYLFTLRAYWKREMGFRAQIQSGRHIMLSSNAARQDCERFYPGARGRTRVVHFAVPAADGIDVIASRAVADGYGLPDVFFYLPNQFWKHKNHVCVIRALQILKTRGKSVVVAASGKQMDPRDPKYFPGLQLLIASSGLEQNFRLLGLIPHEHIPALLQSSAALINPSTFEGWSTTVEEAKAIGVPMILSSLSVHREQSSDAQFFDAQSPQQLADILEAFQPLDPEERSKRTVVGVQQASKSIKMFANEFTDLIEQATSST